MMVGEESRMFVWRLIWRAVPPGSACSQLDKPPSSTFEGEECCA